MNDLNDSLFPVEHKDNKAGFLRSMNFISYIFLTTLFLPVLIYLLFHWQIFEARGRWSISIEKPVALVITPTGLGTAFLIGESRMLTALHVVEDLEINTIVEVIFEKADPQISTEARLVWKNPNPRPEPEYYEDDFAVLELISPGILPDDFPKLVLGSSLDASIRDKVILIGYPSGLFIASSGTISNDNVKGLKLFVLDAGAWPGSSGGPLILESTKEVIGVLIAGLSDEMTGLNLANKIDDIIVKLNNQSVILD